MSMVPRSLWLIEIGSLQEAPPFQIRGTLISGDGPPFEGPEGLRPPPVAAGKLSEAGTVVEAVLKLSPGGPSFHAFNESHGRMIQESRPEVSIVRP